MVGSLACYCARTSSRMGHFSIRSTRPSRGVYSPSRIDFTPYRMGIEVLPVALHPIVHQHHKGSRRRDTSAT